MSVNAPLPNFDADISCNIKGMAEREGFEPSVPRKRDNGFRDRPDRPLRHLSAKAGGGLPTPRAKTAREAAPPGRQFDRATCNKMGRASRSTGCAAPDRRAI